MVKKEPKTHKNAINLSKKEIQCSKKEKEESFTMDTFNSRYKKLLVYKQFNDKNRPK